MSTCIPFLERCIPKELLIPIALENSIHDDLAALEDDESQSVNTTEDEEVILKESSSSSASSASSSSGSCFSPSARRRGNTSYPHKGNSSAADRPQVVNSPRLDRPNRPFSNLKR